MHPTDSAPGSLASLLRGKTLVLTGATGFLAKVFLEKLLRVGTELDRVYLLLRAEDSAHAHVRAETEIFSSPIFDGLRSASPERFRRYVREKVRIVSGDTSRRRLGLSAADHLTLSAQVDVVVSVAASTDFMNRLDHAVLTNALSAKYLSEFTASCRSACLLHVSTCFVNEHLDERVEERLYPQSASARRRLPKGTDGELDLDATLTLLERSVASALKGTRGRTDLAGPALVRTGWRLSRAFGWNNVYTFTKWLGERFIAAHADRIRCAIVRPSIVESCWLDPAPGWIEGWKVADPLIYAVGTGRISFFPAAEHAIADLVPVDLVANSMFVALAELLRERRPGLLMYQASSSAENPLTVKRITEIIRNAFACRGRSPLLISRRTWSVLRVVAHSASAVARLVLRRKPGFTRFIHLADTYSPYTLMRCTFDNTALRSAHERLTAPDRALLPVSCGELDWEEYLGRVHIPGLFRHVLQRRAG